MTLFSISQLFKRTKSTDMNKFLIVGLGNIGIDYAMTRHNIGFEILDYISSVRECKFETVKLADITKFKIKGKTVFLLKPNTFMNLSGKAVKHWMDNQKIKLDNILVISDDLNLKFGQIRLRKKGSSGGHNGLENISQVLGTENYSRLRIGISNPGSNQIDYVLGKFTEKEYESIFKMLSDFNNLIESFVLKGADLTMNNYNN